MTQRHPPLGRAARALGPVLVSLAAGCGSAEPGRVAFTQVEVQAFLEREAARTLPGLAVGAASCPAELPAEAGGTASCTVVVERVRLRYEVQRLVGDRFEARPERPIVVVRDIVTAVRSKLGAPTAQVRCGDATIVQPAPGEALTCQITSTGPPRTAKVEVGPDGAITVSDA